MLAAFCNPERLALLAVCRGLRQLSPQERRVIVSGLVLGLDQWVYVSTRKPTGLTPTLVASLWATGP